MKKTLIFALISLLLAAALSGCAGAPDTVIDIAVTAAPDLENLTADGVATEVLPIDELEIDELFEIAGELYPVADALCNTMERDYFGAFEPDNPAFVWDVLTVLYRRDGSAELSADGSEDSVPGDILRSLCSVCFNGAELPALPEGISIAYDQDADVYTFTGNPDRDITTDIIRVGEEADGTPFMDVALLGTADERELLDSYRFLLTPSDEGDYPYTVKSVSERYTDIVLIKEVRDTDAGYIFVVDYVDLTDGAIVNAEDEAVELLLSQYATVDGTGAMSALGDTEADVEECKDDVCEPGDSDYLIKNCTRMTKDNAPLYLAIKAYNGQIYDMALLYELYFD